MSDITNFLENAPLNNIIGQVTGSASDNMFPDISALQVKFKATSTNIGSFFLGCYNTTYWELDAGQETEWIPVNTLGDFQYRNPSGTSDTLTYWAQR